MEATAFLSASSTSLRLRTDGPLICSFISKSSALSFRRTRYRVVCAPAHIVRCCADAPPDAPVREVPFEIRGFSLANVGLGLGISITLVSLSSYLNSSGTASATSLGFVYGVPILLIGCALKYAELQPVPLASTPDARALRDSAATDIQKKIVSDVTRHRYGDEAHLSAAMSALGLVPRGAACPALLSAAERDRDGKYVLALEFYSVETPYKDWEERVERMERFFGPDVTVEIEKLDGEKRLVELRLVSQR
jgi:hypothetical protein